MLYGQLFVFVFIHAKMYLPCNAKLISASTPVVQNQQLHVHGVRCWDRISRQRWPALRLNQLIVLFEQSAERRRRRSYSHVLFVAIRSLVLLDWWAQLKSINVQTKYTEIAFTFIATHLDHDFSSSIVHTMDYSECYISETELAIGLKFGAKLVLLMYLRDHNFAKIAIIMSVQLVCALCMFSRFLPYFFAP